MAGEPERIARDYFAALARRELLAPRLRESMRGFARFASAQEVVDFFARVFGSVPDWTPEVRHTVAEGDEVAG